MSRHNREGHGDDQLGYQYEISYQPDWLHLIKVTRSLESGRQSTKTLFRNPTRREQPPGQRVRTHIVSADQKLDFEIVVHDPGQVVKRVIVETAPAEERNSAMTSNSDDDVIIFTIEDRNPPPEDPSGP
jgi:hypothetical protein